MRIAYIEASIFLSLRVNRAPIIGRVTALLAELSLAIRHTLITQALILSYDIANWYASFNSTIRTSRHEISTLFCKDSALSSILNNIGTN